MSGVSFVVGASLFVAALWGLSPLLDRTVLQRSGCSPVTVMVVGLACYALSLSAYALWHGRSIARDIRSRLSAADVGLIALASVGTGFVGNLVYLNALRRAEGSAPAVSALVYCAPLFTLLFAVLLTGERVGALAAGGILLIVAGVACVSAGLVA